MTDIRNFVKVMNLDGSYSAISKNAEIVTGFGGVTLGYSVLVVTKYDDQYRINVYIKNEWGDKYTLFSDYTYRILAHRLYVTEADWDHEEEVVHDNFLFPLYFSDEGKKLFTDIVKYLMNK